MWLLILFYCSWYSLNMFQKPTIFHNNFSEAFPPPAFLSATSFPTSAPSPFSLTPSIPTTIITIMRPLFHSKKMNALDWRSSSPSFVRSSAPIFWQTDRQQMDKLTWTLCHSQLLSLTSWSPYFLFLPTAFSKLSCSVSLNVWVNSLCVCTGLCRLFVSLSCVKENAPVMLANVPKKKNGYCWKRHAQKMAVMKRGGGLVRIWVWSVAHLTMKLNMLPKNH